MTKLPEGHNTITAAFIVEEAPQVVTFLQKLFGARLGHRFDTPDGKIAHAELHIGNSVVMLASPMPAWPARPGVFTVYVDGADAVDAGYRKALELGATSVREPVNEFYGHRVATVNDVGGNRWTISAVVEDVSDEEMQRRMAKLMGG